MHHDSSARSPRSSSVLVKDSASSAVKWARPQTLLSARVRLGIVSATSVLAFILAGVDGTKWI